MSDCPSLEQLERFAAGGSSDDATRQHLEACASCRALLEKIRQNNALLADVAGVDRAPAAATSSALPTDAIEGYQILAQISRGGQGVVYRAIQHSTRRTVALKVLLQGTLATSRQRLRFEREIELVAGLQHPSIVTVHDSGVTPDGRHYFAMEYIDGVPLDAWLSSEAEGQAAERGSSDTGRLASRHAQLSVPDRLRLFVKICDAVNYAHQRGVIHRDLKPGNVLIDAAGEPRVLDFGLAKPIGPDAVTEGPPVTLTGDFLGTLAYASPEQIRGDPHLIDVRSDVYSLGVVLYEMLTGHHPYPVVGPVAEIVKNIAEAEPEPPSSWYRGGHRRPAGERDAARRGVAPQKVDDELETIILKALVKDIDHRYQSVTTFASDIQRYLRDEPILARPPSAIYQFRKFARRNRVLVGGIVAVVVALVLGSIGTTWQALAATKARAQVELAWRAERGQRARAERRFDDVRQLANVFIFDLHDQIADLAGATPARELLVATALEYLESLAQEAGDDAELQRELAVAYLKVGDVQGNPGGANLGDMAGALASYRKGRDVLGALSQEHSDPDVQRNLADAYRKIGLLQVEAGGLAEALASFRKSLEIDQARAEARPDDTHAQRCLAIDHDRIGSVLGNPARPNLGDTDSALAHYQKSLEIRQALAEAHPDNAQAQADLSVSYENTGDVQSGISEMSAALASYQKSLEINKTLAEAEPHNATRQRSLANSHLNVGSILSRVGRLSEALGALQEYQAIAEALALADPDNVDAQRSVSAAYTRMGRVQAAMGRTNEALANYRKALAIDEAQAQAEPDSVVLQHALFVCHFRIAGYLAVKGEMDEALASYRTALEVTEAACRVTNDIGLRNDMFACYTAIGTMLKAKGELDEAMANYDKAWQVADSLAAEHPEGVATKRRLLEVHSRIGNLRVANEQYAEALASYREFQALAKDLAEADPDNVEAQRNLAVSYFAIGEVQEKLSKLDEALASFQQFQAIVAALAEVAPDDAVVRQNVAASHAKIGAVFASLGRTAEAQASLREFYEMAVKLAEAEPENAQAQNELAGACRDLGNVEKLIAADESLPRSERLRHWQAARSWYQRSLDRYNDLRERGIFRRSHAAEPDKNVADIAECDAAIAELETVEGQDR